MLSRFWPVQWERDGGPRRASTSGATTRDKKKEKKLGGGQERGWRARWVLLLLVVGWMMYRRWSSSSGDHSPSSTINPALYANLPASVNSSTHPISNSLLHVDLSAPISAHPIYQLIRTARQEWDDKVRRQSKTLGEAVTEYKRRNGGMNPPRGFDRWWKFVV
jgi:hypothetical protein